jgi:hypothetical protein
VEAENIVQVLCSGCDRNLKSGTLCDTCGRWFHNSCENEQAESTGSGKTTGWVSSYERRQLIEVGRRATGRRQDGGTVFPGIRTEQLRRVVKSREKQGTREPRYRRNSRWYQ